MTHLLVFSERAIKAASISACGVLVYRALSLTSLSPPPLSFSPSLPSFVCCLLLLRHISPFSFSSSSSREAEWIIHAGETYIHVWSDSRCSIIHIQAFFSAEQEAGEKIPFLFGIKSHEATISPVLLSSYTHITWSRLWFWFVRLNLVSARHECGCVTASVKDQNRLLVPFCFLKYF